MRYQIIGTIILLVALSACEEVGVLNDPYLSQDKDANILYLTFTEAPKRLDPATAYLVNEGVIIDQIYQPPLQYHYLLRPYKIIPQTLTALPKEFYYDNNNQLLSPQAPIDQIAYTIYELQIKPGIMYQPHPALAKNDQGEYIYLNMTAEDIDGKRSLKDFPEQGTRELIAEDYVYQIKRLAAPNTHSPILGLMRQYIVGLDEFSQQLNTAFQQSTGYVDLRQYPLSGVEIVDRYTYRIKINKKYPQFIYWLTMHFFAPIPWEADAFYQQPGLIDNNISLNWYPIGTGPYLLTENNPNLHMVLKRNPNFSGETYPNEGMPEDEKAGLLELAGKPLPFTDSIVFTLEKESIPQWNKFVEGYYDYLRLDVEAFEQAIQVNVQGLSLSDELRDKNLNLQNRTSASVYYWGFNMQDPVVGGNSDSARKLRKAISLTVNFQEFINIFLNGLGQKGIGPIPPEIFGYDAEQTLAASQAEMTATERMQYAKQLMVEAGYPNGIDNATGKPLVLAFDAVSTGSPDAKARFGWLRKELGKLGIELEVRATQLARFQQKMHTGDIQLFYWTWIGDYPDPENFLFLFYGPSAVAEFGGNNRSNYQNPEYDRLFEQMKNIDDSPEREQIITQMLQILQNDIPWFGEIYPNTFTLSHEWVAPLKASDMVRNGLKYQKIDPELRAQKRKAWNKPEFWPLIGLVLFLILLTLPVVIGYYRQQFKKPTKG